MPAQVSTCSLGRECRAKILWARMASGKSMPLDYDPDPEGNVAVYRDASGVVVGRVLKAGEERDAHERTHMSHFATCPAKARRDREAAARKAEQRAVASAPNVVSLSERRGRQHGIPF